MNHHPDIDIRWRTTRWLLSTHDAGGLTQLDIELAHASPPRPARKGRPSVGESPTGTRPDHEEAHDHDVTGRLNWLRAGVLGANDGIVSTAGLVIGVAAATADRGPVLMAGLAGLAAGAMSMGVGEYVSVSTQRDSEQALIAKEVRELREEPEAELAELAGIYAAKGISPDLSLEVARQLTAHDALGAHAEAELGIDPDNFTNPWQAAWASMAAFTVGALLPLLAIVLPRSAGGCRSRWSPSCSPSWARGS